MNFSRPRFRAIAFLIAGFIAACGSDSGDPDLAFTGSSAPPLSDTNADGFNLAAPVDYWETRGRNPDSASGLQPSERIFRYDADRYASLSEAQISDLAAADSQTGFRYGCIPASCAIYAVAVTGDTTLIINSTPLLLAFIGTIDTAAELTLWLWAADYELRQYRRTAGGYEAFVVQDNACGRVRTAIVFVDTNGVITELESVVREDRNAPCT